MSDQLSVSTVENNSTLNDVETRIASQSNEQQCTAKFSRILQDPMNDGSLFARIQHRRYMCGACGEEEVEQHLNAHHTRAHPEVSFTMDMYELCEIDERIQCLLCYSEESEENFDEHMNQYHPKEKNESINNTSEDMPLNTIPDDNQTHCIANQMHWNNENLEHQCLGQPVQNNHLPNHNDVFQIVEHEQKKYCDNCGKHLKKLSGYHNICISDIQFIRFLSQNRIYYNNGRLHLKDFH